MILPGHSLREQNIPLPDGARLNEGAAAYDDRYPCAAAVVRP